MQIIIFIFSSFIVSVYICNHKILWIHELYSACIKGCWALYELTESHCNGIHTEGKCTHFGKNKTPVPISYLYSWHSSWSYVLAVRKIWTSPWCNSYRSSTRCFKVCFCKILVHFKNFMFFFLDASHTLSPYLSLSSNALKNLERFTVDIFGKRTHGQIQTPRTDDFDCTLCFKLFYDPITTPCGHTFCRSCLFQSMDQGKCAVSHSFSITSLTSSLIFFGFWISVSGNRCPLCRTVLFISPRTCAIRWVDSVLDSRYIFNMPFFNHVKS